MCKSSEAPKLKLTYFSDNKGRNELARLIFAVGKTPYEDNLIGLKEYTQMRESNELPYGQLPILTITTATNKAKIDLKSSCNFSYQQIYGQSCSIARYAARVSGLYPKDEMEILQTDGIVDSWRDTLDLFYETVFARTVVGGRLMMLPNPQSERSSKLSIFLSHELEEQFSRYEKMLAESPSGHACNDKSVSFPSWADLAIFDLVKTIEGALTDSQFHNLMKDKYVLSLLVQKVEALDTIQSHLKKHPYKDISNFFGQVSILKKIMEVLLFPIIYFVFGIFTRVQALTARSRKRV